MAINGTGAAADPLPSQQGLKLFPSSSINCTIYVPLTRFHHNKD
jgi:hypothetical protein